MIKKIENCTYCGEKMESITAKKKYCSPKCRVYHNRKNNETVKDHFTIELDTDKTAIINKSIELVQQKQKPLESLLNDKSMPKGLSLQERINWMEKNK